MHAIKGSWVGQTFALAKCNESESGGKKTRIRRSKEERKVMVESFIKIYQKKNNGSFPSLNLTHKEVGGSFYTVREIVREIIQENRVLGPAKSNSEGENSNHFLEENPLGLMATEPHIPMMLPQESQLVSNNKHSLNNSSELVLNGNYVERKELEVVDGQTVTGAQVDVDNKEPVESEFTLVKDNKLPEEDIQNESESSELISLASVEVETFPLRSAPATKQTDRTDESLVEEIDLVGASEVESTMEAHTELGCNGSLLQKTNTQENSSFADEKTEQHSGDQLLEQKLALEDNKGEIVVVNSSMEKSDGCPKEVTINGTNGGKDVDNKEMSVVALSSSMLKSEQEKGAMEAKNSLDTSDVKILENRTSPSEAENSTNYVEVKSAAEPQQKDSLQKGGTPTLDRINLESWEVASKKSTEQEINPLLAVLKAFIASFVKFWTE